MTIRPHKNARHCVGLMHKCSPTLAHDSMYLARMKPDSFIKETWKVKIRMPRKWGYQRANRLCGSQSPNRLCGYQQANRLLHKTQSGYS